MDITSNIPLAIAGLKFAAPNAKWVSANGFTVNKTNLVILQNIAKNNNLRSIKFLGRFTKIVSIRNIPILFC